MSVDDGESAVYGRMVWCSHEVAMHYSAGKTSVLYLTWKLGQGSAVV